jgi:hypothetical protein
MAHDGLKNGRGIRETRRFNDDSVKISNSAVIAAAKQIFERVNEIAPNRAAKTAGRHQDHFVVDLFDQEMIESDFAEFVDEHNRLRQSGIAKKPVQQGRFAGAEEAGNDGDWNGRRRAEIVGRCQLIAALPDGFMGCIFVSVAFLVALTGAGLTLFWAVCFVSLLLALLASCFGLAPRRIESALGSGCKGAEIAAFSGDA